MKLILLSTTDQLIVEGKRQHNALMMPDFHRFLGDRKVYSLRDEDDQTLLTLSLEKDNVVRHVVGSHNAPPTSEQLEILQPLLEEKGFKLEYDPKTAY